MLHCPRSCIRLAAALTTAAASSVASAQAIRVTAVNAATGAGAPNALLTAVDARDSAVANAVTSAGGGRLLGVPSAGSYRVVVRRIGQRPFTSAPVTVGAHDTVALTLRLPTAPVVLVATRVVGTSSCVGGPRADPPGVAALWDQIRTAVRLVALQADDSAATAAAVRRFITHLDAGRGTVLTHTVLPAMRGRVDPFGTAPPESLATQGYVRRTDSTTTYAVPDGATLLSPAFAREHCFDVVAGGDSAPGWIGLAFVPVRGHRVSDVAGVLWADSATAALRALEFRYVFPDGPDLRDVLRGDLHPRDLRARGEAHFDTLPNGVWAMVAWRLRTREVELGAVARREVRANADTVRPDALPPRDAGPASLARLAGRVRDGEATVLARDARGHPLVGATVVLAQQRDIAADGIVLYGQGARVPLEHAAAGGAVATTGPDGSVTIPALPPGRYVARVTPRAPDGGDVEPPFGAVVVAPGARATLTITPPTLASLAARCPAGGHADTAATAIVYGTVVDERGLSAADRGADAPPVRDARVTARWPAPARDSITSRQATTDRDGRFVLCGVPRWQRAFVSAEAGRREALGRSAPVIPAAWKAAFVRLVLRPGALGAAVVADADPFAVDVEGTVRDSVTGGALAGAVVQFVDVARPADAPLTAAADATGTFRLARVPAGRYLVAFTRPAVDGSAAQPALVELRPDAGTATIALAGRALPQVLASATRDRAATDTAPRTLSATMRGDSAAKGIVTGVVRDPRGRAVADARVRAAGGVETRSRADGTFTLRGVPQGRQLIEAAAIGYTPRRVVVRLRAGQPTAVTIALGLPITTLAPVAVRAAGLRPTTEFARRMQGGFGRFLTAADLDARKPRDLGDVLQSVPGLYWAGTDNFGVPRFTGRGRCPVTYFLDGFAVDGLSELDSFAPVSDVGGVEIYANGYEAPAQYGRTGCAVVLVWTKEVVY